MDNPPVRVLILLPIILVAIVVGASMTGLFVAKSQAFTDEVNITASNETGDLVWSPENPGDLEYVKISGTLAGPGRARLYLRGAGKKRLIFDSRSLPTGPEITGMVVAPDMNNTGAEATSNTSGEQPEDTGTNATGNETGPETHENITQESNITEDINITEPPEGNATLPEANETVGNIKEPPPEENITLPETNVSEPAPPENITEPPAIPFEAICIETCLLEGFSEESYELEFDIEPGTVLLIERIEYSIRLPQEPGENITLPGNESALNESAINETPVNETAINETPPLENITLPENLTPPLWEFPNITPENLTLTLPDVEDINDMLVQGFGMYKCGSPEECNTKISSMASGGIMLLDSPVDCDDSCIELRDSSNIILDCRGNPITGSGSGSGISLENSSYIIIKNCNISGFETGISFDDSSNYNIITDTQSHSNTRDIKIPSSVTNIMNNIKAKITISGKTA